MANNLLLKGNPAPFGLTSNNFEGSDCSGSVTAENRTLDVSTDVSAVALERKILHPTLDYIVSGTIITFLVRVDNRMNITVFS